MSHITLYRKYRPTIFKNIIGQEHIVETLVNSIKLNKISHSYIFSGPKGVGKTSIAKIFAKVLNCLDTIDGDICDKCNNCQTIKTNRSTDILELDAASNNSVENIRNIIETCKFLPSSLKYRVYIIDEAHMLTTQAWNALLKTVEETPEHVIFIFATTEFHKIPLTIVSRCQVYKFSLLNNIEAKKLLNKIQQNENIKISDEAADKIIELANGSARDLLSITEQLSLYTNNDIKINHVYELFGLTDKNSLLSLIKLIITNNYQEILNTYNVLLNKGTDFSQLLIDILNLLIDLLVIKKTNDFNFTKVLNKQDVNMINISESKINLMIDILQNSISEIKTYSSQQNVFLLSMVKLLSLFNKNENTNNSVDQTSYQTIVKEENLDNMFDWSLYKDESSNKQTPTTTNKPIINKIIINHTLQDIFNAAGSNTKKEIRDKYSKILTNIKNSHDLHPLLNPLAYAKNVYVASENCVILTYDDSEMCYLLNNRYFKNEFQEELAKYTKKAINIIGLTKKEISQYLSNFNKTHKSFNDIKFSDNHNLPTNEIVIDEVKKILF